MTKRLILLFIFMSLHNVFGNIEELRKQAKFLENDENAEINATIETIKNDLLSEEVLMQDAGCIILLKTLKGLKQGDEKAEHIFTRLTGDKKVVYSVANIIDSRLLGWYNIEKSDESDDDIKMYAPLFHILGKADDKTAKGTMARAFLYLQGRNDILERMPVSEGLVDISLKRLKVLSDKLCCLYPGRDFVVAMLEKDSRFTLLNIFARVLMTNKNLSEKTKKQIKNFIVECMEYGDSKNGYLIRMKAVEIAGLLLKGGERDLARRIEDLSRNDSYYVHKNNEKSGYSLTELRYPVREISSKIFLR